MAHTIRYEGESTVALDAVLAYIAPGGGAGVGGWYVEVAYDNGRGDAEARVEGWVEEWAPGIHTGAIATCEPGDPERLTGRTVALTTDQIATLTIP